jgi:hypothetical protein
MKRDLRRFAAAGVLLGALSVGGTAFCSPARIGIAGAVLHLISGVKSLKLLFC